MQQLELMCTPPTHTYTQNRAEQATASGGGIGAPPKAGKKLRLSAPPAAAAGCAPLLLSPASLLTEVASQQPAAMEVEAAAAEAAAAAAEAAAAAAEAATAAAHAAAVRPGEGGSRLQVRRGPLPCCKCCTRTKRACQLCWGRASAGACSCASSVIL